MNRDTYHLSWIKICCGSHFSQTYGPIGIVANRLRKPGGVYESLECEHRSAHIMQLIGVKEGTMLLPGFDDEEVDGLVDMLCCD